MSLDIECRVKDVDTSEVELDHLEVRDPDGRLGDPLLVVVVPLAPEPLGLVPDLNEVLVILDHDVVLVKLAVHVRLGPALQVVFVNGVYYSIVTRGRLFVSIRKYFWTAHTNN